MPKDGWRLEFQLPRALPRPKETYLTGDCIWELQIPRGNPVRPRPWRGCHSTAIQCTYEVQDLSDCDGTLEDVFVAQCRALGVREQ